MAKELKPYRFVVTGYDFATSKKQIREKLVRLMSGKTASGKIRIFNTKAR